MALNARHTVNLFFSFKAPKNIRKLIIMFSSLCVDFGLWCEFFAGNIGLAARLNLSELVDVHHHLIAYLPLRCYGNRVGRSFRSFENMFWWKGRYFSRWYYWKNKQPKPGKVYSSQVTTLLKISLCCRWQMLLVNYLHQLFVELKTGFKRHWHREDVTTIMSCLLFTRKWRTNQVLVL